VIPAAVINAIRLLIFVLRLERAKEDVFAYSVTPTLSLAESGLTKTWEFPVIVTVFASQQDCDMVNSNKINKINAEWANFIVLR
jgi:hypothetical protein